MFNINSRMKLFIVLTSQEDHYTDKTLHKDMSLRLFTRNYDYPSIYRYPSDNLCWRDEFHHLSVAFMVHEHA